MYYFYYYLLIIWSFSQLFKLVYEREPVPPPYSPSDSVKAMKDEEGTCLSAAISE